MMVWEVAILLYVFQAALVSCQARSKHRPLMKYILQQLTYVAAVKHKDIV
jgi:hypothetical protein